MPGPVISTYSFTNATGPFAPTQTNGGATTHSFAIIGSGATYSGTRLNLPVNTYLDAGQLGITLPTNANPALTQTPASLTLSWIGILPAAESPLCSLFDYGDARFELTAHWDAGKLRVQVERSGTTATLDSIGGLSMTAEETVGVRYDDDPSGAGGTVTFLRNGAAFGPPQAIAFKLRVTPQCEFQCNASVGNTSNSALQKVRQIAISVTETSDPVTPPGPGDMTVYGDPATRFALGVDLGGASGSYNLTVPSGLTLVKRTVTPTAVTKTSAYTINALAASYPPTQTNGGIIANALGIVGSGATYTGSRLNLPTGTYLSAGAIGISLPTNSDPAKTRTPRSMTLGFKGILPLAEAPLVSLYDYGEAQFSLYGYWSTGQVAVYLERDGQTVVLYSATGLSNTAQEDIGVRYDDNLAGAGGTIIFLRNGAAFGPAQPVAFKPKITPDMLLESNASFGNTGNSVNLKVKEISVKLEVLADTETFTPVSSGSISGADIERLYVDALSVSTPQPSRTVSYTPAGGGTASTVNVIVGPLDVPVGTAYRAILENWSTGSAVSDANVLVMTRPVRQNCQFEDATLRANQPRWMECLPQGPVPVISNIAYYCEATRIGTYVQFQFGYDWTAATMPDNPFGDPSGKESYMVPHKWRIEDKNGTVLATIQRPDGGPLNGNDVPGIFTGTYDGNGVAVTNATNKWYPRGTVRAGVIWRSGAPAAYDQAFINANLPRYDVTIGYASHTHYSNNGFDVRLWGADNSNGFGNTRVMPYEPSNYATLTTQVGLTSDPWKGSLYSFGSLAAVASTWLKYTPFNQSGRSPLTGPGGVRDDRAALAEPVGQYMYNVAANRPHDSKPWSTIALDYLTAYVSDPYHCFEGGRCVPLFKGANGGRDIGLRNHYYGQGEASRPANRSWYIQGGRPYEMADSYNPWTAKVPYGGSAIRKPYFGANEIDLPHAHQFPHWGSLLCKTPEFAFLGHKLSDQGRLYENFILASSFGVGSLFAERSAAWQFLHSVLIWKTASRTSDRLYSRAEIMQFVVNDFESFSDQHKTSTPGFDHPPANVMAGGSVDQNLAVYAATQRFGVCGWLDDAVVQHDFYIGYWLTALGIGERLGFNAALRAASTKAGAVLDWIIAQHRKRVVGRINNAPLANPGTGSDYLFTLWPGSAMSSAGGAAASLPQTYAAVATQNGNSPTWDVFQYGGSTDLRDGQAMDQLIAAPSILRLHLGQSGSDLTTAETTATTRRSQKKTEQQALGANGAGTTWFKYLQAAHNPAIS
ncbi:hypothetical protein [Sphingomonas sp. ERG5]|uniref:hypothetical protein n=1 Tax=Sphingomonas sp. ERG5 TaxID=1381597 RepID=UPI0009DD7D55|nr:hypothetical protein [Sphingomonas sp. ERG5]